MLDSDVLDSWPDPAGSEDEVTRLRARVADLEARLARATDPQHPGLEVNRVPIQWDTGRGTFEFLGLPGVMMWIDTTMAGLLAGVQAMVGPERFALCLQGEGRKGTEADIEFLRRYPSFEEGFHPYAETFAAAGWGRWEVESLDLEGRQARFRIWDSWEGRSQSALGVCWGSAILAGKLSGLCTHLFGTPCWAEQTHFLARGDAYDGFLVTPSSRTLESEMERLLVADAATRADMAVALQRLRVEVAERKAAQDALQAIREELEVRVEERTQELATANRQLREEVAERRRAENQFRRIAEGIPQPLAILSLAAARGEYVNPAFERIFGSLDHEVPDWDSWFLMTRPDPSDREAAARRVRDLLTQGATDARYEDRIRCVSGEDRDFELRFILLESGRYLVLAQDLTEQRRLEKERERLSERLHRSQKMEALGMLAGGVAHDLNNQLSGLVTYPDVLLESLPPGSPLHQPLTVIQQAGIRAAAVVEDLVTIARGVAVPRELCDLNQVVEGYLASPEFRDLLRTRPGLGVAPRLGPDLLAVLGSPVHLRKSLANLVLNAVEALEAGGRVRITTENRQVPQHEEVPAGEYVLLTVEDDGPGIRREDLGRIFEPFFTKKVMGRSGTGLGLAVVWNTVQDHHGHIQVHSDEQGTRFEIFLPATRTAPEAEMPAEGATVPRGRGERVLVVDDEEAQRDIASAMLRALGYDSQAAASGEEAVDLLAREPFDLVLLDMIMPQGWSGRETYERMLEVRPGQKAIIASGYAETEDVRETQRRGAAAFLRKPYRLATLATAMRAALGSSDRQGRVGLQEG